MIHLLRHLGRSSTTRTRPVTSTVETRDPRLTPPGVLVCLGVRVRFPPSGLNDHLEWFYSVSGRSPNSQGTSTRNSLTTSDRVGPDTPRPQSKYHTPCLYVVPSCLSGMMHVHRQKILGVSLGPTTIMSVRVKRLLL